METLLILTILQIIFFLFPMWRIYTKAGLNPTISLTVLIPFFGLIISALILSLLQWNVRPRGGN
jgi:hypothetical protein